MWVVTRTNWIWGTAKKVMIVRDFTQKSENSYASQYLTYQLNGGEVFLPPQVLLVVGAHSGQTVVRVHDNMDHAVEQGVECPHPT